MQKHVRNSRWPEHHRVNGNVKAAGRRGLERLVAVRQLRRLRREDA